MARHLLAAGCGGRSRRLGACKQRARAVGAGCDSSRCFSAGHPGRCCGFRGAGARHYCSCLSEHSYVHLTGTLAALCLSRHFCCSSNALCDILASCRRISLCIPLGNLLNGFGRSGVYSAITDVRDGRRYGEFYAAALFACGSIKPAVQPVFALPTAAVLYRRSYSAKTRCSAWRLKRMGRCAGRARRGTNAVYRAVTVARAGDGGRGSVSYAALRCLRLPPRKAFSYFCLRGTLAGGTSRCTWRAGSARAALACSSVLPACWAGKKGDGRAGVCSQAYPSRGWTLNIFWCCIHSYLAAASHTLTQLRLLMPPL